jgi:tetratricopeptide (TPR) repeat protein
MRFNLALIALLALVPDAAMAEPLIGPAVGNADFLVAEGARLYNEKSFEQAKEKLLKATRAAPAASGTYLSLARAYFALGDLDHACLVYRIFVKSSPESPDRDKAQSELELCERQSASKPAGAGPGLSQTYVALKASFFDSLDKSNLIGPASASEALKGLIDLAYAAPDLGDMAAKLSRAAEQVAEGIYKASLARQTQPADEMKKACALYRLAIDFGAAPGTQLARVAFLEGIELLGQSKPSQALVSFEEAVKRDPSDTEARFYRALARYRSGDRAGALAALEADLPNDPRTGVLRLATAFEAGPPAAAAEIERFLFLRRFKVAP